MAPALEDDGSVVGAVAILIPHEDIPHAEGVVAADDLLRDMAAWVDTAASAYARLLIDVLGERPQSETTGTAGSQEGQ